MTGDATTGIPVPEAAATGIPRQPPAPDDLPAEQGGHDEAAGYDEAASEAAGHGVGADDGGEYDAAEPDEAAAPPGPPPLSERDARILEFERQWWRHAGAKEQAIRDAFGLSPTRYYQVLNSLLDEPAAAAHDPVLVGRLRRLRAARGRSRPR